MKRETYTVPLPEGFTEEDMRKESVFGGDYTLWQDVKLMIFFVDRICYRSSDENIRNIHKMFKTIQTKKWKDQFNPKETKIAYLLQVYESMQPEDYKIIEISRMQFVTACMIIEGIFRPAYLKRIPTEAGLHSIVQDIFREFYGKFNLEMSMASAEAIKGIRNKIVHEGSVTGNLYEKLPKKTKDHLDTINSKLAVHQDDFVDSFIAEFLYLFEDMVLRAFGLEQKDIARNLRPACASMYWK